MPWPSTLIKCGWNNASDASKRSPANLISRPSGNVYCSTLMSETIVKQGFHLEMHDKKDRLWNMN